MPSTSRNSKAQLADAAEIIRSGGLVIVATETFYGLAADPFQEKALERIFAVKERDRGKPLPLIASRREMVEAAVEPCAPWVAELMSRFWPGSLTILFTPAVSVSRLVTGPFRKIGVRVPPQSAARDLAENSGGWITATSANLSGDPSADEVFKISEAVLRAVDLVIDTGPTPGGLPSTVIEPLESSLKCIRPGAVPYFLLREFAQAQGLKLDDAH